MACVAARRGKWVLDYYDQSGARRWVTYRTEEAAQAALRDLFARGHGLKIALKERSLPTPPPPMLTVDECCGIYFLWRDKVVVYVGQSQHIFSRIKRHIEDGKVFNEFSWAVVRGREQRTSEEARFIRELKPEYNSIRNPHNPRISRFQSAA